MSFLTSRLSPASCALFDYIADGSWGSYQRVLAAAIAATIEEDPEGSLERGKTEADRVARKGHPLADTSDEALIEIGARLIASNTLMVHARSTADRTPKIIIETIDVPTADGKTRTVRNRVRFADHNTLMDWRDYRSTFVSLPSGEAPTAAAIAAHKAAIAAGKKSINPITASIAENTPSGIPESLMWRFAPRKPFSMAHFATETELDFHDFVAMIPATWELQDPTDGKYRVWVPIGEDEETIKDVIKAAAEAQGRSAKSLKVEGNTLLRRDVKDLPEWFREYLFPHYLRIATGHLARKRRTSKQVLNISSDDLNGYVALWLLDAAASFDPDKSNFGQYALSMVQHRFGDLVRHLSGRRYASKIESDVRKAEEAIVAERLSNKAENGDSIDSAVSDAELAKHLGVTADRARDMRGIAGRVSALRAPVSIDVPNENGESAAAYALADDYDVTDEYEREEEHAFATRLLLRATAPEANKTRRIVGNQPNVIGLTTYYLEHINGMTRAEAAERLSVEIKDVNAANTRVRSMLTTIRPNE